MDDVDEGGDACVGQRREDAPEPDLDGTHQGNACADGHRDVRASWRRVCGVWCSSQDASGGGLERVASRGAMGLTQPCSHRRSRKWRPSWADSDLAEQASYDWGRHMFMIKRDSQTHG